MRVGRKSLAIASIILIQLAVSAPACAALVCNKLNAANPNAALAGSWQVLNPVALNTTCRFTLTNVGTISGSCPGYSGSSVTGSIDVSATCIVTGNLHIIIPAISVNATYAVDAALHQATWYQANFILGSLAMAPSTISNNAVWMIQTVQVP